MSKYDVLWGFVNGSGKDDLLMSFDDIEKVLGFKIDHSFLTYKKELAERGYEVKKVSLKDKTVRFLKIRK